MPKRELLIELWTVWSNKINFESLYFKGHWSRISWERMKEGFCIVYFPRYFHNELPGFLVVIFKIKEIVWGNGIGN